MKVFRGARWWGAAAATAALTVAAGSWSVPAAAQQEGACGGDYAGARLIEEVSWYGLSQCWSLDERRGFWFTSQGSRLLPYAWFLALEQETGTEPFRSPANMSRLGYIPVAADQRWNPDGLPIGFAKGETDGNGVTWMGPTCAACHTNLIVAGGKPVIIDGAPTLGDYEAFNNELVNALIATNADEAKFGRFAQAVLQGDAADPDKLKTLRNDLQVQTQVLADRNEANAVVIGGVPHRYGNGRVDAVGAILNQIMTVDLKVPTNRSLADAPVSFPFLWGAPQSTVVQWNGLAPNAGFGFGPLVRNIGEVLGVYGTVEVTNTSGSPYEKSDFDWATAANQGYSWLGYKSSVNMKNLGTLENWLGDLRSPQWPADLLGYDPQTDKAAAWTRGLLVYTGQGDRAYDGLDGITASQAKCVQCHALVPRAGEGKTYRPTMVQVSVVGTDPGMADNYLLRANPQSFAPWQTGVMQGTRTGYFPFVGDLYGPTTTVRGSALVTTALGIIASQPFSAGASAVQSFLTNQKEPGFDPRSYKARPLNGVWATAPFLHNGSVPTLYDLLLPAAQRPATFSVGSRVFDPDKVGFATAAAPNTFVFDTSLKGNSNAGHDGPIYGTGLSEAQRQDLLTFLKSL